MQSPRLEVQLSRYGTPSLLGGSAFRLSKPASASTSVGDATRELLSAERDLFGLTARDDLVVVETRSTTSGAVVHLQQHHDGMTVHGGGIVATVDTQGDIVHLHNGTVPDIYAAGLAASKPAEIQAALRGARPNATAIEATPVLRATDGLACGTAQRAWHVRYRDVDGPRVAWIADDTRTVQEDRDATPQLYARTGLSHVDCQSSQTIGERECSEGACPTTLGPDRYNVCVWMNDVWTYLADSGLHGSLARNSFDDNYHCMEARFVCDDHAGGYHPMDISPFYETRGVVAHEFGHGVVASRINDAPAGQTRPVYEHLADIFAMAVDTTLWRVERTDEVIRDWANPDLALDGNRLWLVSWKASGPYNGTASVAWRQK